VEISGTIPEISGIPAWQVAEEGIVGLSQDLHQEQRVISSGMIT
jgi:hypothetical protein